MNHPFITLAAALLLAGAVACEKPAATDDSAAAQNADEANAAASQPSADDEEQAEPEAAKADDGEMTAEKAMDELPNVTPEELSAWIDEETEVHVYDVNGDDTRHEFGTVPGAKLLASSSDYDESELPSDKNAKLVFYCANPSCMAAPTAAARAVNLGYTDVSVMRPGIKGWKDAGMTVASYEASAE